MIWSEQEINSALEDLSDREVWHDSRYIQSLIYLQNIIVPQSRILNLGQAGTFDLVLQTLGVYCDTTPFDIRYPFPIESEQYDLILMMEVIEHLKDQEIADIGKTGSFESTGILNALNEAKRVVVPNGHLFLTTPNVAGYKSLFRLLNQEHPFTYPLHTKELTINCVKDYLNQTKWQIVDLFTRNVWNNHGMSHDELRQVQTALASGPWDPNHRQDCIFALARK